MSSSPGEYQFYHNRLGKALKKNQEWGILRGMYLQLRYKYWCVSETAQVQCDSHNRPGREQIQLNLERKSCSCISHAIYAKFGKYLFCF